MNPATPASPTFRIGSRLAPMVAALASVAAPADADARINVVATLPDLAALAQAVGGSEVTITALASASEDPHYVDPKPSLMLPLNRADLLIVNGLGLEDGWLGPLVTGARNGRIQPGAPGHLNASEYVQRIGGAMTGTDRARGDVHPGGNPHYTYDPRAGLAVAKAIRDRLSKIDPAKAEVFATHYQQLAADLEPLLQGPRDRITRLTAGRRSVVVYHQSLDYLLDWLGLTQAIAIEPQPGIPPTPGHVSRVLSTMKGSGTRVILQEEHYPRKTSQTLAKLASGSLVVLHTATRFREGESYVEHIRHMAEAIIDALKP